MKSIPIKLSFAEEVKAFVSIVNRYPYDMDLRAGRHVVDAKSILGIFSLDLGRPIALEVYTDSCDDLERDIAQFKDRKIRWRDTSARQCQSCSHAE